MPGPEPKTAQKAIQRYQKAVRESLNCKRFEINFWMTFSTLKTKTPVSRILSVERQSRAERVVVASLTALHVKPSLTSFRSVPFARSLPAKGE
jgi:hypothetical protein